MKRIFILVIIGLCSGYVFASNDQHTLTFGKEITLSNAITVEQAIGDINKLKNQEVLLKGTVSKLCEVKGCWMVLKGENSSVRVTFKNYDFFVPKDIAGKLVQAQGVLSEEVMSISQARHFAKDAGKSDAEIQQIQQQTKEYRLVATAVKTLP